MKKIRHCHPMYRTVVLCSKNLYPHKTNFWLRPLTAAQSIQIIISHQSPLTRPESTQYDAGQLALCSSHISSHLEPDISVRQKSMSHGVHYRSSISNKHSSVQLRDHRPVCVCVCVCACACDSRHGQRTVYCAQCMPTLYSTPWRLYTTVHVS